MVGHFIDALFGGIFIFMKAECILNWSHLTLRLTLTWDVWNFRFKTTKRRKFFIYWISAAQNNLFRGLLLCIEQLFVALATTGHFDRNVCTCGFQVVFAFSRRVRNTQKHIPWERQGGGILLLRYSFICVSGLVILILRSSCCRSV